MICGSVCMYFIEYKWTKLETVKTTINIAFDIQSSLKLHLEFSNNENHTSKFTSYEKPLIMFIK
jgi:hypothetical protein